MFITRAAILGLRKQVGGPARKANHILYLVCILPISSADWHSASLLCFLGLPYNREGPGLLGGHRSASREVIPRASGAEPEGHEKLFISLSFSFSFAFVSSPHRFGFETWLR